MPILLGNAIGNKIQSHLAELSYTDHNVITTAVHLYPIAKGHMTNVDFNSTSIWRGTIMVRLNQSLGKIVLGDALTAMGINWASILLLSSATSNQLIRFRQVCELVDTHNDAVSQNATYLIEINGLGDSFSLEEFKEFLSVTIAMDKLNTNTSGSKPILVDVWEKYMYNKEVATNY